VHFSLLVQILLYCEQSYGMSEMREKVRKHFGVDIEAAVEMIPLRHVKCLSAAHWPRFTMLGQALASVAVAWSGLRQAVPEVRHLSI
jgi:hypothetical protein